MEADHPHYDHRRRKNNWVHNNIYSKPATFIVILILTFAIGYFSNSSSNPPVSNQNTHLAVSTVPPSPPTQCPDTTGYSQFGPRCVKPIQADQVRQQILDKVYNGTSPFHNFPPAYVEGLLQPNKVTGWGSYGAVFKNLITKVRPSTIIEVGTFFGASAIHMARLTKELGLDTQIVCVDDFRGWPGFSTVHASPMINGDVLLLHQFLQNVMHFKISDTIIPMPFSAGSVLEKLCEWGVQADLIVVDAGHDFHSAWVDINRAHKLLRKPGGILFGHDYFNNVDKKGVRRAVDLFAELHGFKISVDGEHWILDSS